MNTAANTAKAREASAREIGKAVKHSFVYGMGGMLQKAVSFLLLPFYTHYLAPRDYGILEILTLAMSLLGMFLSFGVPSALLRYYGSADTDEERRRIVSTAYLCVSGFGLFIIAIGTVLVRPISLLLFGPGVPATYLLLMLIFFILGFINTVPVAYLRAEEASGAIVAIETGCAFCILALSIYLVAVLKLGVLGVLLSQVVTVAVVSPVLAVWMIRRIGVYVDSGLLRKLVSFGAPLVFASLAMFTLNFSDRLFLQRFRSLDAVGIYSVGYKFGYMINFLLIQPFNTMWMARMYQIERREDAHRIFAQVFVLYSVLLISVALGFALFGSELVKIMADSRYAAGARVVPPVVLAYVFLGIGSYLQLGTFLASRTTLIGIVSLVAGVLNLGLNYFLIRPYGMMGAAWATTMGFLTISVGSAYCSQRVYPLDLGYGRVLRGLGLAMSIFFLSRTIRFQNLWTSCLVKGAMLSAFLALLVVARVIHREEIHTIRSLVSGAATWLGLKPFASSSNPDDVGVEIGGPTRR
jgi:O-antigen/teichoic acid export membrane protein